MAIYIRSTSAISPQKTFGKVPFLEDPIVYTGNRLKNHEPDYTGYIDAKPLRRMSRIIKMGVAAALECLKEAGEKVPGAIITGTALGCEEDTGIFLSSIIEQQEELLQPTPFIQSTHNTVGAQIALLLNCHSYNNTFAHRGFSFENALQDAIMLLNEKEASTVLAGGIDEITDINYTIFTRFGLYKQIPVSNLDLINSETKGTIAGEGSVFFLLGNQPTTDDHAQLEGVSTYYKPVDRNEREQNILSFLASHDLSIEDIDLVITGRNGDYRSDALFNELDDSVFKNKPTINYKQLCGEYPTSSSFALWLAANIMKTGVVPPVTGHKSGSIERLKRILIYNHYLNIHHSLMLVSSA